LNYSYKSRELFPGSTAYSNWRHNVNVLILSHLERPLYPSDFGLSYIPQIHPLNVDVDFANMKFLDCLPGNAITFSSLDTGNKAYLDKKVWQVSVPQHWSRGYSDL
jgi:hypothetical protein